MSVRLVVRIAAWILLALLVLFTLGPIQDRPRLTHDPNVERFLAFAITGVLFGLAYPTRRVWMGIGLVGAALVLELGQLAVPGRDGHLIDATFKAAGAVCGVGLSALGRFGKVGERAG